MYYNCFLTRLWRHKFWNNLILLIKPFCYAIKKWTQKFKYLENEKSFWGEIKSIFHHLKDFQLPKVISDLRVHLLIKLWISAIVETFIVSLVELGLEKSRTVLLTDDILDLNSKNTWSTILEWFYDILNLDLWKTLGLTYWTQTDFIITKQGCFSLHFLYKFLFICSRKDEQVCLWEDVFCVFVCMRSGSNSVGFEWWHCILSQKF